MKKIIHFILFAVFVICMFLNYGCRVNEYAETAEGKIVYKVTYPELQESDVLKNQLPQEMVLYFKDNKVCAEILTGKNISTRIITDSVFRTYYTLVQTPSQKQALILTATDVANNYKNHVPLKITFTENTKEIAGVICKEAVCVDSTQNTWSVFYNDKFKVNNPNWATPFSEINGLMMEYEVMMNGRIMNLEAKSVNIEKVSSNQFIIPGDYKINTNYRTV